MTFRVRMIMAFLGVMLVPSALLFFGLRRELGQQVQSQYRARLDTRTALIDAELVNQRESVRERLAAIADALSDDNRFRLAATSDADRDYMLEYASRAMRLTGLEALQVQDESGRILSSGHFRNEFDRIEDAWWRRIGDATEQAAIVELRSPAGPIRVLASLDSVRLAGQWLTLVGGVRANRAWLAQLGSGEDVIIGAIGPGWGIATDRTIESGLIDGPQGTVNLGADYLVREIPLTIVVDSGDSAEGRIVVAHALEPLRALEAVVNLRFTVAFGIAVVLVTIAAGWVAAKMSRPLRELADKTARLDLTQLDVDFGTQRKDEIGSLSRLLASMVGRLRTSRTQLRDAERRATTGDLARQLNHDIKNGLVPIRNVFRHLSEVSTSPDELATTFEARAKTVETSITYLEELAANYARLSPQLDRRPCDVTAVLREIVAGVTPGELVQLEAPAHAHVLGDAVVLHRIFENVIRNGIDSLDRGAGTVTISVDEAPEDEMWRTVIADTGRGMTEAELNRSFEEFYTTKERGTGLGLAIVRRLILDLGGALRVETEPGVGTRVIIGLPAVNARDT